MSKSLRIGRSLLEIMLLLIAAGSGIVVAACVIITMGDFDDECLLYSYVNSKQKNGRTIYTVEWKGLANCRFIIIVQVFAAIFALITIAVQGYFLVKRKSHGTSVVRLFTGLYTVSWTFILVSSCILSAGFREYCDSWLQSIGNGVVNCKYVQEVHWTSSFKMDRFYDVLSTAQTATWISFTVWMLLPLVAWAGVHFVTNRRHQETASDIPT